MSLPEHLWRKIMLSPDKLIRDVIANLNESGLQIVLVVDDFGRLLGTVTDGDIRRGLLRGGQIDSPLSAVMRSNSLVVPPEMGREMVAHLMRVNKLRQLPVVDGDHRVVGLHLWDDDVAGEVRSNTIVIMAGGLGKRMRPHTETCPKPMLPVAGKPMLEHIIERARGEGFRHFVLAIMYLGHVIEDYFGDGSRWDVSIDYLREISPLGTAGALGLLNPQPSDSFIVTNGDVLSDIRYGEVLDFHYRQGAAATMAVRLYEWQHPFGVVQTNGVDIVGFEEKPVNRTHINAGIYALSPQALTHVKPNMLLDMPSLFEQLQYEGKRTVAFPMHEPWLDVGRPDDLALANKT
ncbi:CBS domain-containing protein [Dechloromonas sp. TW-R-39-2]|uniref:nucleotidyltransferase family protein n=1 Tax=Dechloromonas sp. TW-R-39-2 TaxID=2654218 RepID=UPI00193E9CDA|nr:nucleotidyltransferase family protein [Dechloromonas sp. TW-R-39-2]QRM20159.1 CBS domain-containing protein [Dechloromonas sp. TW-R-39-2]